MKTTPPRLLSLNSYHYRRGGSDVVYLEHDALFQELGWETAVMSMHHPKNMPSRWSEYFVEELEFGYAHGIKDKLVNEGQLKRYVNIYINDEDIRFSNGLNTVVRSGDELTILPAVAGGCGHVKAIALHDMKQQARYNARS